ncbi:hypothetical protein CQW23_21398 [Capsicum baccatum]|uniref:NB-ARC domain-containing protein n=1 Tax=Capsicum baccatum TaxID=33114 RepID=A0A2G2VXX8_CAPBA|nr:hypothetical protein CQW23_21398 [Capsicum baccatum]
MADAVVEFLLLNLKQLLLYHVDLLSGVKDQVESLHRELSLMKAFLKDSREKRSEYEYVRELVSQITVVAYEAEDIIDTFVTNAAMQKARSTVRRAFHVFHHSSMLRNVAKEIESIKVKVKEIYDKKLFGIQNLHDGESSRRSPPLKRVPIVEEENVVGFDEEAKTMRSLLTNGSEELQIISIVGMGGLGKTTLAKKVYTDPSIEYHFYNRAWIYVSQQYSRKEVFLGILDSLSLITDEMYKMNDEKLALELSSHLRSKRYLLVIDDVWTMEAWDDLKMAFPNTASGSRILLTARNRDVASYANPEVSGLLLKKEKTRDWWKKVANDVSSYVARDPKQCMDVLALSYKHLPDHLKVCFIYFGIFPEDFEIPVWKLLRLWTGEGFIQQMGQECLEDTAEEYLEDLVDRNLVLVVKKRANGRIKTCRIHDILRDLSVKMGSEEKFLEMIKGSSQSHSSLSLISKYHRRLCVHSHFLDFMTSSPSGPSVRSFLVFASEEMELPREHTSFLHEAFRLARELDIQVDIWKTSQFKHLYTSGLSCLRGPPAKTRKDNEDPFVRRNIQTISTVLPDCCKENILARTPGLRKLGIRGKLATLVATNGDSSLFDNLAKLDNLETLKLLNDTFPIHPSQCQIPGLPQSYKFPSNLKKLTLSDTFLDWSHISTLGMLPNLEVLKLKDYAFKGTKWEPLDGGFCLLRVLHIGRTNLEHWNASGHHFHRLQQVFLEHCSCLNEIPFGLVEVPSLQNMELFWPIPAAAASTRTIQQNKQGDIKDNVFKLVIYPPDI